MLVDDIAIGGNQVAQGVDATPIQVKFIIVRRVFRHVMSKSAFDPPDVPLCKIKEFWWFLVQYFPKLEHYLRIALLIILDNIVCVID